MVRAYLGNTVLNKLFLGSTQINDTPFTSYVDYFTYLNAGYDISYVGTGSTWYDISGNNNDATLTNSPTYGTTGSIGFIEFGSTQNADLGQLLSDSDLATNFEMAAWVYIDSLPTSSRATILSRSGSYQLYVSSSGYLDFEVNDNGTTENFSDNGTFSQLLVPTGSWFCTQIGFNGATTTIELNDNTSVSTNLGIPTTGSAVTDKIGTDRDWETTSCRYK